MGCGERLGPFTKGLGMLRNLKQSSKPVGAFEAFKQRSDMILSLYYFCFVLSLDYYVLKVNCRKMLKMHVRKEKVKITHNPILMQICGY